MPHPSSLSPRTSASMALPILELGHRKLGTAIRLLAVATPGTRYNRLERIGTNMTPARDPKQGKYMDLDLILIGFDRFSIRMG